MMRNLTFYSFSSKNIVTQFWRTSLNGIMSRTPLILTLEGYWFIAQKVSNVSI